MGKSTVFNPSGDLVERLFKNEIERENFRGSSSSGSSSGGGGKCRGGDGFPIYFNIITNINSGNSSANIETVNSFLEVILRRENYRYNLYLLYPPYLYYLYFPSYAGYPIYSPPYYPHYYFYLYIVNGFIASGSLSGANS